MAWLRCSLMTLIAMLTALATAANTWARWVLPQPAGPKITEAGPGQSGQRFSQAWASALQGATRKSDAVKAGRWPRSRGI